MVASAPLRRHKGPKEMATFAGKSVRSFFRDARHAAGNRPKHPWARASIGDRRPEEIVDVARKVAGDQALILTLRNLGEVMRAKGAADTMRGALQAVGATADTFLPALSPEGRRDVRAVCALTIRVMSGVTDDDVLAGLEALTSGEGVPDAVAVLFGLAAIVLLAGRDLDYRKHVDAAARELWALASKGEAEDVIEDALDSAVYWEARANDPAERVPYNADDLTA